MRSPRSTAPSAPSWPSTHREPPPVWYTADMIDRPFLRLAAALVVPALAVGGLTACQGDADTTATTTTSTTVAVAPAPSTVPVDTTRAYFDSLAAGAIDVTAAAPAGSDADVFAVHQQAARAILGQTSERRVNATAAGFDVCDGPACTSYTAVVNDPATSLVVTFSIDGVALAGRVSGEGPIADRDGIVVHVVSAYRSSGDELFVVLEVTDDATATVELFDFAAVYEPTGLGGGFEATGAWGVTTVEPGETVRQLVRFPGADPGGRLRLTGLRSDGLDVAFDLVVPAPTSTP